MIRITFLNFCEHLRCYSVLDVCGASGYASVLAGIRTGLGCLQGFSRKPICTVVIKDNNGVLRTLINIYDEVFFKEVIYFHADYVLDLKIFRCLEGIYLFILK